MNVIVFGATGTIGQLVVKSVLEDGHSVTAFARNPEKLPFEASDFTMFAGDVSDPQAVMDAIKGQDAVIVTLGAGMSRKSLVRSVGTRNIIAAMQEIGVKRLVCQSTLGAHESRNNLNFYWKYIMFGLILRPVLKDHERQEDLVRESDLDWTLVRPSGFIDGPARADFKEDFPAQERNLTLKISRKDVANFLKRQLSESSYMRRAVGISY